jgi:hypothetical protein
MSDPKNSRPTFIKATNVDGLVMKDNVVRGDIDFAQLDNVSGVESSGNLHVTSGSSSPAARKSWYERPAGIVTLGLLVAVVAGGVLHWLGWV